MVVALLLSKLTALSVHVKFYCRSSSFQPKILLIVIIESAWKAVEALLSPMIGTYLYKLQSRFPEHYLCDAAIRTSNF